LSVRAFAHLRVPILLALALVMMMVTQATAADTGRTRELVRYPDVELDVITEGAGPLVILLPSRGSRFRGLRRGRARQSRNNGFRVFAAAAARHRQVDRSDARHHVAHDFGNDIAAVIRHYGGPAVIVGHALGNWVARTAAADHPDLVRGVVIAAAAAKTYPSELSVAVTRSGDMSLPKEERLKYLRGTFFLRPAMIRRSGSRAWHPQASESQRLAGLATRQQDWWAAGKVPLLDLQAAEDSVPSDRADERAQDELGDRVTVAVIANASHALLPEQPKAVVDAIVAWVRQL